MCIPGSGLSLVSKATGIKPIGLISPALGLLIGNKKSDQRYGGGVNADGSMSFSGGR